MASTGLRFSLQAKKRESSVCGSSMTTLYPIFERHPLMIGGQTWCFRGIFLVSQAGCSTVFLLSFAHTSFFFLDDDKNNRLTCLSNKLSERSKKLSIRSVFLLQGAGVEKQTITLQATASLPPSINLTIRLWARYPRRSRWLGSFFNYKETANYELQRFARAVQFVPSQFQHPLFSSRREVVPFPDNSSCCTTKQKNDDHCTGPINDNLR